MYETYNNKQNKKKQKSVVIISILSAQYNTRRSCDR